MKKDNLDEFIRSNRDQMDQVEVPSHIWQGIQLHLDNSVPKRKRSRFFLLQIAAGAAIFLMAGIIGGMQINNSYNGPFVMNKSDEIIKFYEAESYYKQKVSLAVNQYKSYTEDPSPIKDLDQLDAIYQELKSELLNSSSQNEEIIINALISNYQTKLEILEKILLKVQENQKFKPDEKISI